jgi:hypothetical protein
MPTIQSSALPMRSALSRFSPVMASTLAVINACFQKSWAPAGKKVAP